MQLQCILGVHGSLLIWKCHWMLMDNGDKGIQFNRHYYTVEGDADILSTVAFVFVT